MDFCTKCGTPIANQAACPNCGQPVPIDAQRPSSATSNAIDSPNVPRNIAFLGAACYLAGWITGIVMWNTYRVMPKSDPRRSFLLFHAAQSLVVFGGLTIILIVLSTLNIPAVNAAIMFVGFVLWLFLLFKAFQGERYKLPIAGDFAESLYQRAG